MFRKHLVATEKTNLFNQFITDYIHQHRNLLPFYSHYPNLEGYQKFLNQSHLFQQLDRKKLSRVLKQQSLEITNASNKTKENIKLLERPNTFTVTTGHQLCLFTGPLYFIYKILSAISLSEWLNKKFTAYHFIPVYWMATEDHDIEEINHIYVNDKKIVWEANQKGAVGLFNTHEVNQAIQQLEEFTKNMDIEVQHLLSLFKEAYSSGNNLTKATHYLVNALFGEYGLVVADGNNVELKKQAQIIFKKDILEQIPYQYVNKTIDSLYQQNYSIQVKPREINSFYLETNLRERIIREDDSFKVLNTDIVFSKEEMENLISNETEKLSPNVVTRPLYQQSILPNIAYVGGPGELAYWLQYKEMFDQMSIPFPILQARQFVLILDKHHADKLKRYNLEATDLFLNEHELIKKYMKQNNLLIQLNKEREELMEYYERLANKVSEIEKTMEANVKAEHQKSLNYLNTLESKLNKIKKQKEEQEITQLKNIRAKLFPDGKPQERHQNISMLYAVYGKNIIQKLKEIFQETVESTHYLVLEENTETN